MQSHMPALGLYCQRSKKFYFILTDDAAGAFDSPLKLPLAGQRNRSNGEIEIVGHSGLYWSSTVDGPTSRYLHFYSSWASVYQGGNRALGVSVRCIND